MSGTEPSKTALFSKRSHRVQKRRRVFSSVDIPDMLISPDETSETPVSTTVLSCGASKNSSGPSPSTNDSQPLLRQDPARARAYSLRKQPRVRTKLKQAPAVPGYDPESQNAIEPQTSYTHDQLKQLKQKLRIGPHSSLPQPAKTHNVHASTSAKTSSNQPRICQPVSSNDDRNKQNALQAQILRSPLSQLPKLTTVKPKFSGTAAAPFSAEWNAQVYDDDDIQMEPVSIFSRAEAHGSDSGSADGEWEAQLMRRAVQKTAQQDQYMFRRELGIIQDAEIKGIQSGAFRRLNTDIANRIEELAGQQAYIEQKIERLEQVVVQDTKMDGNANVSVENLRNKVGLYENLAQRISDVSKTIAASVEVFEKWEDCVDREMAERFTQVIVRLEGGIDQFGRERKAQVRNIEEARDSCGNWGGRLAENVQPEVIQLRDKLDFNQILESIMDWCERFPEEYISAFADVSSGKLLGRLALLENDISYIQKLEQRPEMMKAAFVSFGADRFASWIKASWEPRVSESCGLIGDLMRLLNTGPNDLKHIVHKALHSRLELEIEALEALRDVGIREVVRGVLLISKKGQFDSGLLQSVLACERICGLEGFEETLEWMENCPFVRDDAGEIRQRRKKSCDDLKASSSSK